MFEFIFLILISMCLSSCTQELGEVQLNIFGQEITENDDLEELFLSEVFLDEEFLQDEWLFEDHNVLSQQEIVLLEKFLVEQLGLYNEVDIHIVQVEQLKDFILTDLNDPVVLYNINWNQILSKFAIGTSVIIVTGILAAIPQTSSVFAASFKGALAGALNSLPQLLNASIQAFKNGGKVDKTIKYSLEKASDDYVWGTVIGAVSGLIYNLNSSIVWPSKMEKLGAIIKPTVNFLSEKHRLINKILVNGEEIISSVLGEKAYNQDDELVGIIHNMGWLINELGNVIGFSSSNPKTERLEDVLIDTSKGSVTNYHKGLKYHITNGKVFIDDNTLIGYINQAGFIYDNIDFKESNLIGVVKDNQLLNGLQEAINAGFSFDGYGKIKNHYSNIDGNQYFIDKDGAVFGRLLEVIYEGNTIRFLQVIEDKSRYHITPILDGDLYKTVGILDAFDYIIPDWDSYFMVIRQAVIDLAWEKELEKIERTGSGTYLWTLNQIQEIRKTGKVKGIRVEYINTTLFSTQHLFNQQNLRFISENNYNQQFESKSIYRITFGSLINR